MNTLQELIKKEFNFDCEIELALDNFNYNKLIVEIKNLVYKENQSKEQINNKINELYEWLKGERKGYFLEDHKTWVNYGELEDKFPYDENDKQRELSRNHMIYKTILKMKELKLINGNLL